MAKRGQGEGTISKRPDGTWWARISLGYDSNGKRKRKAFYGKTRKEVQEKLTAALNDINNDVYIEPSNMELSDWINIWIIQYKKNYVRPSSYESLKNICKIMHKNIGNISLKELRADIVQCFIQCHLDKLFLIKIGHHILQILENGV